MTTPHDDMIRELAGAQVGEFVGGPLLSMEFFKAVQKLKTLPIADIQDRYDRLKQIDQQTAYEIVWTNGELTHEMNT